MYEREVMRINKFRTKILSYSEYNNIFCVFVTDIFCGKCNKSINNKYYNAYLKHIKHPVFLVFVGFAASSEQIGIIIFAFLIRFGSRTGSLVLIPFHGVQHRIVLFPDGL